MSDKIPHLRFTPLDRVTIGGNDYIYIAACEDGHVMRRPDGVLEETFTHSNLAQALLSPGFRHDRGFYSGPGTFARSISGVGTINDLPPAERTQVVWKQEWCRRFLVMELAGDAKRSDASMKAAIKTIFKEVIGLDCASLDPDEDRKTRSGTAKSVREPPCPRTLRNWLKLYETSGHRPIALRNATRHSGNREPRLDAQVHAAIAQHARGYASETKPTINKCWEDVERTLEAMNEERVKQGLPPLAIPSIKVVAKAIKALPATFVYAGRHGQEAARKRFSLVTGAAEATRCGERVEMDEWRIHLHKILIEIGAWDLLSPAEKRAATGRHHACVAIDVASRCMVGLMIAPTATGNLAKATLRMMVSDKTSVAKAAQAVTQWDMRFNAETVVSDGGSGLTSDEMVAAVHDLGAEHRVPRGGNPRYRGTVERSFRTIDTSLLQRFTGRSFSNVAEKGDYDAEGRASVTLDAFCTALVRWVVDAYHNTPHAGLGGETPRNAYLRLQDAFGIIPPPGADQRRAIFGVELGRVAGMRGVRVLGLHYLDEELGESLLQHGEIEVTVRVDQEDLGAISIRNGEGWRRLPCRTEGMDGVTLEHWLAASGELRRRFAVQAQMTRPVVIDALAAIERISRNGQVSVGISRTTPTAEEIDRLEADVMSGFEVPIFDGPPQPGSEDPFDRAIPTGGDADETAADTIPTSPTGRRKTNFRIEE